MSAAATSAGYLYASGRLRGRGGEPGQHDRYLQPQLQPQPKPAPRAKIRVAVLERDHEPQRRTPKIEYRVRKRWSLE